MKVVFILDRDGNFDSFFYPGDKASPFIPPPKRDEPKDTAPPDPPRDDKPKPS